MRASLIAAVLVAGTALIVSEAAMQPTAEERFTLYALIAAAALVAGCLCWWLTRIHRRLPSLRWTILVVALTAVGLTAAVVGVSAATMFLALPDVRFVLGALTLGTGLGVLVAFGVTGPLTQDLRQVAQAAQQVADGDLTVSTGIVRRDEVGALATSVDRMVAQLAELEAQRERGQAARRSLLASIGHDLRTPLSSLRAALEAIQDGIAPDPERYLATMAGDIELLSRMVDDLFVLARLDAGDLSLEQFDLDLSEVADGAVDAVTPVAAQRGVQVRLDAQGAVTTRGDGQALHRVLRNLLDNAIRHSPDDRAVMVHVHARDGEATMQIVDQGPGFPEGFAEHAFERFSRPDAARERHGGGAGLGLAIAKELVEAHGGHIAIESSAGGGVVTVTLPLTAPTGAKPASPR